MLPIRDNIPSRTTPVVNYMMILACVMVFLMQLASENRPAGRADLVERYGMVPQRVVHPDRRIVITEQRPVLTPFGVMVEEVQHRLPRPAVNPRWTLLTCIFLHGGWLHIIGNMWFLFIFGDNVEDRLGHVRYLLFYLGCGLAGSVAHLITNWNSTMPTVGASGAIAGIMGAYFILYPRARVLTLVPIFIFLQLFDIPAPVFLGIWFLLQFLQGMVPAEAGAGGVAWWAHIGGFVFGVAVALLLRSSHLVHPPVSRTISLPRGSWSARRW